MAWRSVSSYEVPPAAPALPSASVAQASYGDSEAVRRALEGLETVLMVSGSESATRVDEHKSFIDAAAAAGVEHLVYVSFYGAAPDATFTLAPRPLRHRGAHRGIRDGLDLSA